MGRPKAGRFHDHPRKGFLETGTDKNVGESVVRVRIGNLINEVNPWQTESLEFMAKNIEVGIGIGADHEENKRLSERFAVCGAGSQQMFDCLDKHMLTLADTHGTDVGKDDRVRGESVDASQFLGRVRGDVGVDAWNVDPSVQDLKIIALAQ